MRARCRVVLTRTTEDNARLRAALREISADVIDYPCIAVEGTPVAPAIVERLRRNQYSAAIFVSRNAVEHFFAHVRLAAPSEVIAIGPATADAILKHGWPVSAVPRIASAAGAIEELDDLVRSSGPVLYVRGELGEDVLPAALRSRGKAVETAVVYRPCHVDSAALPTDERPTLLTFASPSAVRHFVERNDGLRLPAMAIGDTTATAARELGFEVMVAPSPDMQGMAAAIHRWAASQP